MNELEATEGEVTEGEVKPVETKPVEKKKTSIATALSIGLFLGWGGTTLTDKQITDKAEAIQDSISTVELANAKVETIEEITLPARQEDVKDTAGKVIDKINVPEQKRNPASRFTPSDAVPAGESVVITVRKLSNDSLMYRAEALASKESYLCVKTNLVPKE